LAYLGVAIILRLFVSFPQFISILKEYLQESRNHPQTLRLISTLPPFLFVVSFGYTAF
jgi:hypothetical protein